MRQDTWPPTSSVTPGWPASPPVTFWQGANGRPEVEVLVEGENAEATLTYVFTFVGPAIAATPAP